MGCTNSRQYTEDTLGYVLEEEEDVHTKFVLPHLEMSEHGINSEEKIDMDVQTERSRKTALIMRLLKENLHTYRFLVLHHQLDEVGLYKIATAFSTMKLLKDKTICVDDKKTPSTYLYILEKGEIKGRHVPANCIDRADLVRVHYDVECIFGEKTFLSQELRDFRYSTDASYNIIHFISYEKLMSNIEKLTKRTLLEHFPLFENVNAQELNHLNKTIRKKIYGPGETIIQEEDGPSSFFIIANGCVKLSKKLETGESEAMKTIIIGRDSFFGEESLIMRTPQPLTAIAASGGVEVYEFSRLTFENEMPQLREKIQEMVFKRLHRRGSKRISVSRSASYNIESDSNKMSQALVTPSSPICSSPRMLQNKCDDLVDVSIACH